MALTTNGGGAPGPIALFDRYKERLRRTVRLRLDRRLSGSSIPRACSRWPAKRSTAGPRAGRGRAADSFLWLRQIVGEVWLRLHERAARPRRAGRHLAVPRRLPEATSISLAAHLLGKEGGDDDRAAARAEQKILLQETLNAMDRSTARCLTLRHCEQLSNDETATVLDIPPVAGQRGVHPRA